MCKNKKCEKYDKLYALEHPLSLDTANLNLQKQLQNFKN